MLRRNTCEFARMVQHGSSCGFLESREIEEKAFPFRSGGRVREVWHTARRGLAIAQAVSRRLPTVVARVRSQTH
jgi:hypothetical protein